MKVLKPFTCKVTKRRYEAGQEYDGKRAFELAAKGFVEAFDLMSGGDPDAAPNPELKAPLSKEKAEVTHTPKSKDPEGEPTKKRTRKN